MPSLLPQRTVAQAGHVPASHALPQSVLVLLLKSVFAMTNSWMMESRKDLLLKNLLCQATVSHRRGLERDPVDNR
jgi:hypothetical protein